MHRRLYDIFRTLIFHFSLARRSNIAGMSRLSVFNSLTSLYFKALRQSHKNNVVTFNLLKYRISAYGYGDLLYLFKEIFLNSDYYFETTNERPLIIDCGANIGMSVLYFKTIYPHCSVIAFEPNPFAFEVLKKNIDQNELKNVRIVNEALADKSGFIEYFIGENRGSLVGSIVEQKEGDTIMKVPVTKLSDFIKNQSIDFIKIDIEGAESFVVKDLVESFKIGNAKKYTVEYHHDQRQQKSRLSNFLLPFENSGYGYSIEAKLEDRGTAQNILIKFSKD